MVSLKDKICPLADVWNDVIDITSTGVTVEVVYISDPIQKLVINVRAEIWNQLHLHVVNNSSLEED